MICLYFLKKKSSGSIFGKKKNFFFRHFVFFYLKTSMDSFLEYILDSISLFKVVDFNVLGLHRLVWLLLR